MNKQIIAIDRASEQTIEALIAAEILYIGEDNKLHVSEGE